MQLKINLATRAFFDARQLNLWIGVAALILFVVSFFNVRSVAVNAGEEARLVGDVNALQAKFKASAKGVSEKDYQSQLERIKFANSLIEKKSLNWLALLDRLEGVVPEGVALTGVDPHLKDKGLTLNGTAKGFKELRIFLENLEGAHYFTDVFLQNQAMVTFGEHQKGVGFSITCKVDFR